MYKPSISICIPTYNRAKYLKEAIDSTLKQDYDNYEVIVAVDGSTDETMEILESYSNDKLKYFYKEHSFAPDTRNQALLHAKGEFIIWLGDDDILNEKTLQVYVEYINKYPDVDIFYPNLWLFNEDNPELDKWRYKDFYNKMDETAAYLIKGQPIPDGASILRKKIYDEVGNYDVNCIVSHDYEFYARVFVTKRYNVKHVDKFLSKYRVHNSNICINAAGRPSNKYDKKTLRKLLKEYDLKLFFPAYDWTTNVNKTLAEVYFIIGIRFFNYSAYSDSIFYLVSSFRIEKDIERLNKTIQGFIDMAAIEDLKIFLYLIKDLFEDIKEVQEAIAIVENY